MTDYRTLITPEHQKPNFLAVVDLVANGIGSITSLVQSIPGEFDLDNAEGVQLDILGQWIGQSRVVPNVLTLSYFGFSELGGGADGDQQPFGELTNASIGAAFYNLGDPIGTTTSLNDAQYRTILAAAIIRNQYDGSLPQLEQALEDIFGCSCAVLDPGLRSIVTLVSQAQSQVVQALVSNYDILPRPAGVKSTILFPVSPLNWTVAGSATASGTTAQKASGVTGWDSSASLAGGGPVYLGWSVPSAANALMGGIASSPATSPSYTTLNFAIDCASDGTVQIYESGASVGSFGAYAAGDTFGVYYDGVNVVYLHNNQIIRTTTATGSFSPMFAFDTVGAEVTNVSVFTS